MRTHGGLDIAEQRLPQDGRIKLRLGKREVDFRVSTIPVVYGERIVLRILDKSNVLYKLTEIGMDQDTYAQFKELLWSKDSTGSTIKGMEIPGGTDFDGWKKGAPDLFKGLFGDMFKLVKQEDNTPLLLGTVSSEISRLTGMLEKLAKLQLDTGMMRRVKVGEIEGDYVDVTEQERVKDALSQSERRFRELADSMPQMVWAAPLSEANWLPELCGAVRAEHNALLFPIHFGAPHVVGIESGPQGFAARFVPGVS